MLGGLKNWDQMQSTTDCVFCLVNNMFLSKFDEENKGVCVCMCVCVAEMDNKDGEREIVNNFFFF